MTRQLLSLCLLAGLLVPAFVLAGPVDGSGPPLGLPPTPIPENNPQTPEKISLGQKLFEDQRFSTTGEISCSTCHATDKAFTDGPLKVSEGINGLTGTRNAPTVLNTAYFTHSSGTAAPQISRNASRAPPSASRSTPTVGRRRQPRALRARTTSRSEWSRS